MRIVKHSLSEQTKESHPHWRGYQIELWPLALLTRPHMDAEREVPAQR